MLDADQRYEINGLAVKESAVVDVTRLTIKKIEEIFLQDSPRARASAESVRRVGSETP